MKEEHKSTEKERYESPVMEIIEIDETDIIISSDCPYTEDMYFS